MSSRDRVFSVAVSSIGRIFVLRDRMLGRIGSALPAEGPRGRVERHSIPSGRHFLDAVSVQPASGDVKAKLLICHGIGETVDHWLGAQDFLAAHGVASLVFDYTGYGKSKGALDWALCERNAISAFEFLDALEPAAPISILGFSLGSGVAAAILDRIASRDNRIKVERLFLCSAFTSFRDAASSLGLPRKLLAVLPPIWDAAKSLKHCSAPVLVVHCERDRLFPVRMAAELTSHCEASAEFIVVPNHVHNDPFYRPQFAYWRHILARLVPEFDANVPDEPC